MDRLFSTKQTVPTTTSSTATAGNHLTSIATSMPIAVSGVTGKNAANHTDSDKEETNEYHDMLTDILERCALKNHPNKIITMGDMKDCHINLTIDQHGAKQK